MNPYPTSQHSSNAYANHKMRLMTRFYNAIPFSKPLVSCISWLLKGLHNSPSLKAVWSSIRRICRALDYFHIFDPIDRHTSRLEAFSEPDIEEKEVMRIQQTRLHGGQKALANIYKRKIAANEYPPDNAITRETKRGNVIRLNAAGFPCSVEDSRVWVVPKSPDLVSPLD
ncbi:hypothetical protein VTL71DRAFT_11426 [Oculimacula yallundae]|uniref:Uncharacterized protein n=1 Tax=Oculimacula yallundae TaxID=86028 RepID=A0ABR4CRT5_9HELO